MPASGRFANISTTTFAKTGGTTVQIKAVQSVQITDTGTPVADKGDYDLFHTFLRVFTRQYSATVACRDLSLMSTLPAGTKGTFSSVLLDAEADPSASSLSGSITVTMANAVVITPNAQAQHAQMGTMNLQIQCRSSDGVTSPVTFAIAA